MLATTAIPDNFLPIQQELLDCLRFALEKVENGLRRQGFPPHVAQEATDAAENAALVVICNKRAQEMSQPARRKWLRVVAYRNAVTLLRRKRTKRTVPLPADHLLPPCPEPSSDPQEWELVLKAVEQLPPDLRAVIESVYIQRLKQRAAARQLGIPQATFRRRHQKAIQLMKDIVHCLSSDFL